MPETQSENPEFPPESVPQTPFDLPLSTSPTPIPIALQGKREDEGGEEELEEITTVKPPGGKQFPHKRAASGIKVKIDVGEPWVPVTEPKYKAFYSDHANPHQKTRAGYTYWNSLTKAQQGRIDAYVYRDWPVFKELPEDSKEYKYIDKILGIEPLTDDNDLLDRYGSGDYHVFLNQELTPSVAQTMKQPVKRTLATFYIRGGRDMKSRPPCDKRISDIDQVDMTDPVNKSYVEFLRMTGKLPEQQKGKELETEMATVEAIKGMADTNARMVDKVIEMAEKSGRREPVGSQPTESNQMIIDASSRAMNIVEEAAKKTLRDEGEKKDPLEVAIRLVGLINENKPTPTPTPVIVADNKEEIKELRNQLHTMQQNQINDLQAQLRTLSEKAATPPPTPPAPATSQFSSIEEGINAFEKMRGLVDKVRGKIGGDEGEGGGETGGAPAWLNRVSDLAPHMSTVVSAARDMFALWQMGGGQTPTQQQTQVRAIPTVQPQPQPQPFQPQPSPVPQLVSSPAPQPIQPNPQPIIPTLEFGNTYGLPPQVAEKLSEIKIAFLNHLEGVAAGELNGGDFADWYIGGFTEEGFKEIVSNGSGILLQAIYAYPPIASRIGKTGASREQVEKFVGEFVGFKPEVGEGEGEGAGPETTSDLGGVA